MIKSIICLLLMCSYNVYPYILGAQVTCKILGRDISLPLFENKRKIVSLTYKAHRNWTLEYTNKKLYYIINNNLVVVDQWIVE